MQVLVYTHQGAHWQLKPFAYLWNVYWSELQPVYVAGGNPSVTLPSNFTWLKVESRIKERWSDGLIEALRQLEAEIVLLSLEDYWLVRTVNVSAMGSLEDYMLNHKDIMKMDLTADRLHSGHAVDIDSWGHCDIIETKWDCPYQFSTQMALWNRYHLLRALRPEMSPWDFELQDRRMPDVRVCGTRQWPVRYINGVGMQLDDKFMYRTEHIREGLGGLTVERIPREHIKTMRARNILPTQRINE